MRKILGLLLGVALALGVAGSASAKTHDWHGTIAIELAASETLFLEGTGVATVNDDSTNHLSTLRIGTGITDSGTIPITDPNSTGQIKSIRISGGPGVTSTFTGISGAPPVGPLGGNTWPMPGYTRVCVFTAGCTTNLPLIHTINNGNTGIGVGGLVTIGGNGTIRISIEAAPWTLGTGTAINQTVKGNFITLTRTGFVHGGGSASNSSTASNSGILQLISPEQITTAGIVGNSTKMNLFLTLTLHFVPEPGLLLLIGSGIVGLGLLGRSRLKK